MAGRMGDNQGGGVRLCTVPDLLAKVGKEAREKMRFSKVFLSSLQLNT